MMIDRDPNEVFSDVSIASFECKPICNDDPFEDTDPDNWQQQCHLP